MYLGLWLSGVRLFWLFFYLLLEEVKPFGEFVVNNPLGLLSAAVVIGGLSWLWLLAGDGAVFIAVLVLFGPIVFLFVVAFFVCGSVLRRMEEQNEGVVLKNGRRRS